MNRTVTLGVVALIAPLAKAHPQGHAHGSAMDSAAARFVAAARAGTVRYRDRLLAIADGYRQVGPELPGMGEHWLNVRLVLADTLDPAHPPVLIYVSSPNGPVLAGAAYTRLLGPGDPYPDFPRGLGAWHDHSGFIEDEALPMAHQHRHAPAPQGVAGTGTRLGMLHLWTGVENPAGAWTPDNWALPFVRAGLSGPLRPNVAGMALALSADSGRYYLDVLSRVGRLDSSEAVSVRTILAAAAADVRLVTSRADDLGSDRDLGRLEQIWRRVGDQVGLAVSAPARSRLEDVSELWWGTSTRRP